MHLCGQRAGLPLSRREMLQRSGTGFGVLALHSMLAREAAGKTQPPPLPGKAKRVIFLFMHGGPSTVDLFDPKPLLTRDTGKAFPLKAPRIVSHKSKNLLLKSPWSCKQHGESGAQVCELLPHIASIADDLCFVKSMHCSNSRHGGALLELHTGSDTFTRPAMGSWINYGLGSETKTFPASSPSIPAAATAAQAPGRPLFFPPNIQVRASKATAHR